MISLRGAAHGQRQFAESMKHRVSAAEGHAVDRLDYACDLAFLEPALFTHFGPEETHTTLDQILYGYLAEPDRPATVQAYAGKNGVVHLPRVGSFETDARESLVTLTPGDRAAMEPGIEICDRVASPFDIFFPEAGCRRPAPSAGQDLTTALAILKEIAPEEFEALTSVTRRIVLYEDPEFDSFATFSAHGTAFLQLTPGDDEVFFLEDIAHQCGHIVFNAMTSSRDEYFEVDPDTPLRAFTKDPEEHRTVYVALHGVFTECLMAICLQRCRERDVFTGRQRHELLGRLSFIMNRLRIDLTGLRHDGLFSARGAEWFREFGATFDEIYAGVKDGIVPFDHRNQSYTFNSRKFTALNPPEAFRTAPL